jgi:hypothetical protein
MPAIQKTESTRWQALPTLGKIPVPNLSAQAIPYDRLGASVARGGKDFEGEAAVGLGAAAALGHGN